MGASVTGLPLVADITCSSGVKVKSLFVDPVMTLSTMGGSVSCLDSSTGAWVSVSSGTVVEFFFRILNDFGSGDRQDGMRGRSVVGMGEVFVWIQGLRTHR